jgi:hypothetical protein
MLDHQAYVAPQAVYTLGDLQYFVRDSVETKGPETPPFPMMTSVGLTRREWLRPYQPGSQGSYDNHKSNFYGRDLLSFEDADAESTYQGMLPCVLEFLIPYLAFMRVDRFITPKSSWFIFLSFVAYAERPFFEVQNALSFYDLPIRHENFMVDFDRCVFWFYFGSFTHPLWDMHCHVQMRIHLLRLQEMRDHIPRGSKYPVIITFVATPFSVYINTPGHWFHVYPPAQMHLSNLARRSLSTDNLHGTDYTRIRALRPALGLSCFCSTIKFMSLFIVALDRIDLPLFVSAPSGSGKTTFLSTYPYSCFCFGGNYGPPRYFVHDDPLDSV